MSPETSTPGTTETFCSSMTFRFSMVDCIEVFHYRTTTNQTKHNLLTFTVRTCPSFLLSQARWVRQPCPPSSQPSIMGDLTVIFTSLCRSVNLSSLYRDLIKWATKLLLLTSCPKCLRNSGRRVTKCSPSWPLGASIRRLSSSFNKFKIRW